VEKENTVKKCREQGNEHFLDGEKRTMIIELEGILITHYGKSKKQWT